MIVRSFLAWTATAPAAARAEGTAALAQAFIADELDPGDRSDAEAALTALLDDGSPLVRLALARVLGPASSVPHHLLTALLNDRSDIAALVLEASPLIGEDELIDAVAVGDATAQSAVARRPYLTLGVAGAIAEVLPDLGADHHLAGGAFAVDAFGEAGAAGAGDAVVRGEGGLADGGAKGLAVGGEGIEAELCFGGVVGAAGAFALEIGLGGGEGLAGPGKLLLEELGAGHGVEFGVFDAGDFGGEEGDFVIEGGGLGGSGDDVHLLAEFGGAIFEGLDVGFVGAPEFFFFGEGVF